MMPVAGMTILAASQAASSGGNRRLFVLLERLERVAREFRFLEEPVSAAAAAELSLLLQSMELFLVHWLEMCARREPETCQVERQSAMTLEAAQDLTESSSLFMNTMLVVVANSAPFETEKDLFVALKREHPDVWAGRGPRGGTVNERYMRTVYGRLADAVQGTKLELLDHSRCGKFGLASRATAAT